MDPILARAQEKWGIVFMGAQDAQFLTDAMAQDASEPSLISTPNSGILSLMTTYVDPKIIKVLQSPMKATDVVGGEVKKGDWLLDTAEFPFLESTGQVSAYGDYNNNGGSGANVNWIPRQSYHYQVFTSWGERELERMGLAKLEWASQQNMASVLTLNKFQNASYFYGIAGLANYGLLNDPSLSAPISPGPKAAGGTAWFLNGKANATITEVYADIQALYTQLQTQANGLVDLDTKMTLVMSPTSQVAMTLTSTYNQSLRNLLKENFPNMKFETAPEYATASGQLVQLIADELEGQKTAETAFTEKLRAHPMIVEASSFKQKKTQGTWGTIIYRPFLIAQLLGV